MSRYIDAEEAFNLLADAPQAIVPKAIWKVGIRSILNQCNAIDIEPKRGEWIAKTENCHSHWVCSECGAWALLEYNEQMCLSNFCPNCGADMRDERREP